MSGGFAFTFIKKGEKSQSGDVMSCIIKKFIAELPNQIKPSMFKKYEEAKSKSMSGTLNKQRAEELYEEATRLLYEKCNKSDQGLVVEDELSQRTASLKLSMKRQEEQLQKIRGTLQAYIVMINDAIFVRL